jgi:hypothetical protein
VVDGLFCVEYVPEVFGEIFSCFGAVVGDEVAVVAVLLVLMGEFVGVFDVGDASVEVYFVEHFLFLLVVVFVLLAYFS